MSSIHISKSIIQRPDYLGEKFSRPMAWIDLLLMADDNGNLSFTISGLSTRWKWDRRAVKTFLKELESNCAINCTFNCTTGHPGRYSMLNLTICNIARYISPCTIDSIEHSIVHSIEFQKTSPASPGMVSPNLPPAPPSITPSFTPPISPSEKRVFSQDAPAQAEEANHPPTPFHFRTELIGLGVAPELADDWLLVRKKKKGVNTRTSFRAIQHEIQKAIDAGYSADACIRLATEKSWVGFKFEWAKKEWEGQPQPKSRIQQYAEKSQLLTQFINELHNSPDSGAAAGAQLPPDEQ